jgi:hypothetical protein
VGGHVVGLAVAAHSARATAADAFNNVPARPNAVAARRASFTCWDAFTNAFVKATGYGAESCPRAVDILGRFGGVTIGPRYDDDVKDVI